MSVENSTTKRRRSWLAILPLVVFASLAAIFFIQLRSGEDSSFVPSVLIGREAPATNLPPLAGSDLPGLASTDFKGHVTLVNVWASWCAPCREEQPLLMTLKGDPRFRLTGLNYKDKPENALRFLGEMGNPFAAIGVDENGRTAIDWGVYGVPETYLVGKDGRVLYKHVGPFTEQSITGELMPAVEKAAAGS
ncbi:DsbE family thiol:disulfide interchange protein [Mesorhizobium koreense]|uniref:DsbE family thiol:disulfide interchange protein n=1 Tax=Mesorhizobium koreense TaxID=3074855 RepID=UPI00287BA964|nr:DsbE family thiol:disulfide interchange protein [Mesorhizobium sp. WR6]